MGKGRETESAWLVIGSDNAAYDERTWIREAYLEEAQARAALQELNDVAGVFTQKVRAHREKEPPGDIVNDDAIWAAWEKWQKQHDRIRLAALRALGEEPDHPLHFEPGMGYSIQAVRLRRNDR